MLSDGPMIRLWPVSRKHYFKKLLLPFHGASLFQNVINRVASHDIFAPALFVANENHRFSVITQVRDLDTEVNEIILGAIDEGDRFRVKRLIVKGAISVTCGEKEFLLTNDQSTYVPLGAVHRLKDLGKVPLHFFEG